MLLETYTMELYLHLEKKNQDMRYVDRCPTTQNRYLNISLRE